MSPEKNKENERAERIVKRMSEYHILLNETYENLVDRNFKSVEKDLRFLIMELRYIVKSIEEDDF
jgi:hypothetical protein